MRGMSLFAGFLVGAGLAAVALHGAPVSEGTPEQQPTADAPTIAMCFAPEGDCAALAIREIDAAEHQVLVNAYQITTGAGFVEALVRAKNRGVTVEVIADRIAPCERHSGIEMFVGAVIPVWIDAKVKRAHAKFMVVDSQATLFGSYNWTGQAAMNSEDLNLVRSAFVARAYEQHWRTRRNASTPYDTRDRWCAGGSEIYR